MLNEVCYTSIRSRNTLKVSDTGLHSVAGHPWCWSSASLENSHETTD